MNTKTRETQYLINEKKCPEYGVHIGMIYSDRKMPSTHFCLPASKIMKLIISIITLFIFHFTYSQTVIDDTLFSDNSLDGGICCMYENNNYYVVHGTPSGPGDGYNPYWWVWIYCRSYYSFDLSQIPVNSDGFELLSVNLELFQFASYGNDERGVYPIWDFPGGDTNYCYLDHVNYGNYLEIGDWTAGDLGDPQTLYPLYTIVTSTPDIGFRYMDVTDLVLDDISNNRSTSQFRIHFPVGTDWDFFMDEISFSGISYPLLYRRPKLILRYIINPSAKLDPFTSELPKPIPTVVQAYPNPFNTSVTIEYQINKQGNYTLSIYNLLGNNVITFISGFHLTGHYSIYWDGKNKFGGPVPSGIYFINLNGKTNNTKEKVLLLR